MKTINEILNENGWNGVCGTGTDKNTTHNYVDGFYEKEFINYREKPVKLLEIGIASGHSLLLWDKYFINHDGIYGLENFGENRKIIDEVSKNDKIKVTIADAYTLETAKNLPDFDIIIDDGPHSIESMVSCIELYLPKLKTGGIMVIEDVQDFSWFNVLIGALEDGTYSKYEIIDLRYTRDRYDDLMFIVRK